MSFKVQVLLIKIEHGPLAFLIPIALHRFLDTIIFGLDKAKLNFQLFYYQLIQHAKSKTEIPELLSETTSFPPLLSSDIALSILTVKVILFMKYFFLFFN